MTLILNHCRNTMETIQLEKIQLQETDICYKDSPQKTINWCKREGLDFLKSPVFSCFFNSINIENFDKYLITTNLPQKTISQCEESYGISWKVLSSLLALIE